MPSQLEGTASSFGKEIRKAKKIQFEKKEKEKLEKEKLKNENENCVGM